MAMTMQPDDQKQWKGFSNFLMLMFYFMLVAPNLAANDEEIVTTAEYSSGARQCMTCHKEGKDQPAHEIFLTPMGISGDPDSPFAEGNRDCETCHGPSKSHRKKQKDGTRLPPAITFNEKTPVETQNKVCLDCHEDRARFHWPGSVHDTEGVACVDCHTVHTPSDTVLSLETQAEVCYNCHQQQRSEERRVGKECRSRWSPYH